MHFKKTIAIALFLIALMAFASACDYVINAGESVNKYNSEVQPGQTVCVKAGTYNETLTIPRSGTFENMITYKAFPGDECQGELGEPKIPGSCKVILGGQGSIRYAAIIYPHNNIRIEGFEITEYNWSETFYIAPVGGDNDHIEIVNNYIHDTSGDAVRLGYGGGIVTDVLIENNEISEVARAPIHAIGAIFGAARNAVVRGNNIHNNWNDAIDASGSNWLVEGNKVYDSHLTGRHEDGINFLSLSDSIIRNNVVSDFTQLIYFPLGDGPNRRLENVEIYGNILYNDKLWTEHGNVIPGIHLRSETQPTSIVKNVDIHSNTIGWTGMGSIIIQVHPNNQGAIKIRNNLVYGGISVSGTTDFSSEYNLSQTEFVNYQGQDSANFDFHLKPTSSAIDAGAPDLGSLFTLPSPFLDIDGNERPQGTTYDIGAYEYAPACQTAANCDDGVSCTTDSCSAGTCQNTTNNSACGTSTTCITYTCTGTGCQTRYNTGCAIPSSLVSWYRFEGNTEDETGNNNGNFQGGTASYVEGKVGQALEFDGLDDHVDIINTAALGSLSEGTISAWINAADVSAAGPIFGISNDAGSENYARLALDTGPKLSWAVRINDSWPVQASVNSVLNLDQWYHVAVTVDGSGNRLYIDGVQQNTTYNIGGPSNAEFLEDSQNTNSAQIGKLDLTGDQWDRYFNGLIDEVKIYNRALTSQEIMALYNETGQQCIDITALLGFIADWKAGNLGMASVLQKIEQWKAGC